MKTILHSLTTRRGWLIGAMLAVVILGVTLAITRTSAGTTGDPQDGGRLTMRTAGKGERAVALVKQGRSTQQISPNQVGEFPLVTMSAKSRMEIEVRYPEGAVGRPVVVHTLDGGKLDNGKPLKRDQLDRQRRVVFQFIAPAVKCERRVAVRVGKEIKVLRFAVLP